MFRNQKKIIKKEQVSVMSDKGTQGGELSSPFFHIPSSDHLWGSRATRRRSVWRRIKTFLRWNQSVRIRLIFYKFPCSTIFVFSKTCFNSRACGKKNRIRTVKGVRGQGSLANCRFRSVQTGSPGWRRRKRGVGRVESLKLSFFVN